MELFDRIVNKLGGSTDKKPEIILNENGAKTYAANEIDVASQIAWQQTEASNAKSLIVYVHGRAAGGFGNDREPHESFVKDHVIRELETIHHATVVMLHWPHRGFANAFPKESAEAAAPLLINILTSLSARQPAALAHIPMVLLTHSMGGIVLQAAATQNAAAFDKVNTIITSASGAQLENSAQWLGSLTAAKIFATRNEKDGTLNIAATSDHLLGLGNASSLQAAGLAANVFYLDVTNQHVSHAYFIAQQEVNTGHTKLRDYFYRYLYQGQKPDMAEFETVIAGTNIYRLKKM